MKEIKAVEWKRVLDGFTHPDNAIKDGFDGVRKRGSLFLDLFG
jgi:hypothetical protein